MKAIITIGIPCSGKSTWAEDFCAKNGYLEINRDNIRMSLFDLERYDDYRFSKEKERQVSELVNATILVSAIAEKNIVISDTNLNKGRREALRQHLEEAGYEVEYKVFEIEFFDALRRNDKRKDKQIPRQAMYRMYRNFMEFQEEQGRWAKYVPNHALPSAYVVDIDGTLATNDGTRGWYDWAEVGKDKPIQATIDIVNMLAKDNHIILLSGRDEVCFKETSTWLHQHGVSYHGLYMRPKGSMDKDRFVKERLFAKHVASNFNVKGVFDDRTQVCLLWYDLGLPLFKVGDPIIEF